jgi:hypothetical protein
MVVLIYLTNMALVIGLGVYVNHLLKKQIEDSHTISFLRGQNMKRREQILDLEAKIKMNEVF